MVGLVLVSLLVLTWPVLPGLAIPVWCDERSEAHPPIGYTGMCPGWVEGNARAGSKGQRPLWGCGGIHPACRAGSIAEARCGCDERSEELSTNGTRERAKRVNAKIDPEGDQF